MDNLNNHVKLNTWFGRAAAKTAWWVGAPSTFGLALLSVVIWAVLGPYYKYSDTWQLVINAGPLSLPS
jgi:low affinity Fe/Cu permease